VDFQDNCPTTFNTDQHNNEGDTSGNACDPDDDNDTICDPGQSDPACTGSDNCVFVANTSQIDANFNGIGDACDTTDTDGDGFSDRIESRITTNAALDCGAHAWPPDFNSDNSVTGSDLNAIAATIGKLVPPAPVRKDIAPDLPDSAITGADLSAVAKVIGTSCS